MQYTYFLSKSLVGVGDLINCTKCCRLQDLVGGWRFEDRSIDFMDTNRFRCVGSIPLGIATSVNNLDARRCVPGEHNL